MVDIENLKLVLYDFDDTLCIHGKHRGSREVDLTYDISVLAGNHDYSDCKPNVHMMEFMKLCSKRGIHQGLISATCSYKHMELKSDRVAQHYGLKLDNFCVGSPENKLRLLAAIPEAYNIPRECILLIDDYAKTLNAAQAEGFMSASPMEIVNYIVELG